MHEILDRIGRLVERLAPAPACDACLAGHSDVGSVEEVHLAVSELAGTQGFVRERALCSLCGEERPVIRSVGRSGR
jgi:hypothetical protein